MPRLLRRTIAAVLVSLLLAAPSAAQEAPTNETVGAPELRGFRLPGTRVVPAEPATAEPDAPEPTQPASRDPAQETPAPAARSSVVPQAQRQAPRTTAPIAMAPASAPAAAEEAPAASLDAFPSAQTYPTQDYSGAPGLVDAAPPAAKEELAFGSMWPALAAGLALLAGLFFMQRRRRAALAGDGAALERSSLAEVQEPPVAPPAPTPVRTPAAVKQEEDEALEPALELHFDPERMVASDKQAAVHFKLVVLNNGKGAARNIVIEAKMFSASQNQHQEIAAFLATPTEIQAPPLTLGPGRGIDTDGAVMLDRQEVREIYIEGLPLFIPTVVIRVVYQWGRGRSGQVHGSYLVGIENRKSPEKMGPFRLDMGPRIYRSVGGRQIELARAGARR